MIRVVLADDHNLVRAGIRALLERIPDVEVVGEADDGRQALALISREKPDVALLDIGMPELNGLEAAGPLAARPRSRSARRLPALPPPPISSPRGSARSSSSSPRGRAPRRSRTSSA